MKLCPKCRESKPYEQYYKARKSKDGLQGYCKSCVSTLSTKRVAYRKSYREVNKVKEAAYKKFYREKNKESITESSRIYRDSNRETVRASQQRYKESNYDKVLESSRKYRERNKPKYAAYRSKRRAQELQAQPPWLSKEDLLRIQLTWGIRELKSFVTGCEYEVDHIVPLQGKTVCGLHVPWNLEVVLKSDNRRKQARYWPDMWTKTETTLLNEVD